MTLATVDLLNYFDYGFP